MKLPQTSLLEIVAVLATVASCAYYLSWWGVTWISVFATVLLIVFGYMAGNMILDLWDIPGYKAKRPVPHDKNKNSKNKH
jgi:predicted Na+-dependent transporter